MRSSLYSPTAEVKNPHCAGMRESSKSRWAKDYFENEIHAKRKGFVRCFVAKIPGRFCCGSPIQLSIKLFLTLSRDHCKGNLGCHEDSAAEANHSIGAKIVVAEPAVGGGCCYDDTPR
jgi:hypothetical protein